MAKNDPVEKLLASLAESNEATLAAIDTRIESKQAEIDEATAKLRKELAGLEQLRKIIDVQVNGKKARKNSRRPAKGAKAKAEGADDSAIESGDDDEDDSLPLDQHSMDRIYEFVAVNGPCQLVDVSRATKIHHHTMKKALKHKWFESTASGYIIAKT